MGNFGWIGNTISSITKIPREVQLVLAGIFVGVFACVLITNTIVEIGGVKITSGCSRSRCIELEDALKEAADELIRKKVKLGDVEHREDECNKLALDYYKDAHKFTVKYRKILPDRNFGNETIFNKAELLERQSNIEEACDSYAEAFKGFL